MGILHNIVQSIQSVSQLINLGQYKLVPLGMFPQLNLQQRSQMQAQLPPHCSSRLWDTSGLEQTKVVKHLFIYFMEFLPLI